MIRTVLTITSLSPSGTVPSTYWDLVWRSNTRSTALGASWKLSSLAACAASSGPKPYIIYSRIRSNDTVAGAGIFRSSYERFPNDSHFISDSTAAYSSNGRFIGISDTPGSQSIRHSGTRGTNTLHKNLHMWHMNSWRLNRTFPATGGTDFIKFWKQVMCILWPHVEACRARPL